MTKVNLIYDVELRRPACILIQAAYGCDYMRLYRYFPSDTWLDSLTTGMRKISGTDREWKAAAAMLPGKTGCKARNEAREVQRRNTDDKH